MITIEYVIRRPSSTISGVMRFGKISPLITRRLETPVISTALTKSRSEMSSVEARSTRATWGACESPTATTSSHALGPTTDTSSSTNTICGNASSTSTARITMVSGVPRR